MYKADLCYNKISVRGIILSLRYNIIFVRGIILPLRYNIIFVRGIIFPLFYNNNFVRGIIIWSTNEKDDPPSEIIKQARSPYRKKCFKEHQTMNP